MSARRALLCWVLPLALLMSTWPAYGADDLRPLEKMLRSIDRRDRADAAKALGEVHDPHAVELLIGALDDRSSRVRLRAAEALIRQGHAALPAIPALRDALEDRDARVTSSVAHALEGMGEPWARLTPVYRSLLSREHCDERLLGVEGLAGKVPPMEIFPMAWACGEEASRTSEPRSAADGIEKVVDAPDPALDRAMLDVLGRLEPANAQNGVVLIRALGHRTPPPEGSVALMAALLGFPDARVRVIAAVSLSRLGVSAAEAAPALSAALENDADPEVRRRAAEAMGTLGTDTAAVVLPSLTRAASGDRWPMVRAAAVEALGQLRRAAAPAVPVLLAALDDADLWVRSAARTALPRVDPAAAFSASAVPRPTPAPEHLFVDPSPLVRKLKEELPRVVMVDLFANDAYITAPEPSSGTGFGAYSYENGRLAGPSEALSPCGRPFPVAAVNFAVVPAIIAATRAKIGNPHATIAVVGLARNLFCLSLKWHVVVKDRVMIEFSVDGRMGRVYVFPPS